MQFLLGTESLEVHGLFNKTTIQSTPLIFVRIICKKKALDGQFNVMEWPPQSPDLSPIELLWDEVDRQVQEKKPTSVESLVRLVKQTWTEISPVVLEKLLNRMPLICQAVIDAQGGYFDEKLSAQKKQLVYH